MTTPTHIASGYLLYHAYCIYGCAEPNMITSAVIFGSLIPDIDAIFGKNINEHRLTPFHAPLYWVLIILVCEIISTILKNSLLLHVTHAFGISIFVHLFLDWLSGRSTGIQILYPFSKQIFSAFPLSPKKGNFPLIPTNKNDLEQYKTVGLKHFLENKFLVALEVSIITIALVLSFFS